MVSDRELIDAAAKGLKIEAEPFKPLSEQFGISEEEVIDRISRLLDQGKIRRFAASVRHQHMGFKYNSMILARTDEANLDKVGETVSALKAVSHCYQRSHPDGDPWCVYIMAHSQEAENMDLIVEKVRNTPGIRSIEVCKSLVELKKTSVTNLITKLKKR